MHRSTAAILATILALTGCGSRAAQVMPPIASASASLTASPTPSPTAVIVAIASATAAPPSSPPATPKPPVATRPPTSAPTVAPIPTPSPTPTQTRVPNSDALPTPHGLPATDGCLYYGAQPPYISFVDCVVHGLPPAAPVTLTANGEVVFLRIGSTVVYPDGSWYFPWYEIQHKEIVFVVTAGGTSRALTQVFK